MIIVIIGVVLAMSVTALAEEKPLGVGTTYKIGDTINVPSGGDSYIIWDDDCTGYETGDIIDPGTYTVNEPCFIGKQLKQFVFKTEERSMLNQVVNMVHQHRSNANH